MFRIKNVFKVPVVRLAEEVLRQISEGGVDSVKVSVIADRMECGIGTLYRQWGPRESMLEHTWRVVVASLDERVRMILKRPSTSGDAIESLWTTLEGGLPDDVGAFLELHASRRRWGRGEVDPIHVVPSLVLYIERCQREGIFRCDPPELLASMVWWCLVGALSGSHRRNHDLFPYAFSTLKRMLVLPNVLADEAIDDIVITVDAPPPTPPPYVIRRGPKPEKPSRNPLLPDTP
ncbi:MAG: TetR/AcrR family transcriptional regulator [Archangiaceae bacterium]|nr:TetR/AcrR family transcriptional regulator [Archangiaceae bacterium]